MVLFANIISVLHLVLSLCPIYSYCVFNFSFLHDSSSLELMVGHRLTQPGSIGYFGVSDPSAKIFAITDNSANGVLQDRLLNVDDNHT